MEHSPSEDKNRSAKQDKKSPAFYVTRRFIAVFTKASQVRSLVHNLYHAIFLGKVLLAPCPTPKQEGHNLLAARDFILKIFAATFHI
jgi:hypothetical protein